MADGVVCTGRVDLEEEGCTGVRMCVRIAKSLEIIKISGLFVFSDAPAMQPCYNYRNLGN